MDHGFKLRLERVTIEANSITGGDGWETRHLNIELWATHNWGETFLDSVVIDKHDIEWLMESD